MAVLTPLITADNLADALNPTTFMAIFDDSNTGDLATVKASAPVTLTLKRAHAKCIAWLGDTYATIPDGADSQIPGLLVDAELDYAQALAWQRHPEYVRTFGESERLNAFKRAEATMQKVQEATLRIVDSSAQAKPQNVGAIIVSGVPRTIIDNEDGTRNGGDF